MKTEVFKNNEPMSSLTHFVGLLLSVAALVMMVMAAARYGTAWHISSYAVFGASLILLYAASAVYHFIPRTNSLKKLFQRIDQSFIFILIAGTYTPVALLPLRGPWGWTLFGIVWGIAFLGVVFQILNIRLKASQTITMYLAMGWLVVITFPVLSESFSRASLAWLFAGGLFYTIGVLFFGLQKILPMYRWFGMHDIFHVFVMAGSFSHFWLMYKFLV